MRRIALAGLIFGVSLAVAADKAQVPSAPQRPSAETECGVAPGEESNDPTRVTFCWSQAAVDALPPDPAPKKKISPPEGKEPEPKPPGDAKPPPPKPGKGTKL